MYQYDQHDKAFLQQRVKQFSKQITRYENKQLNDDQFRSLRLRNGLYLELHAYMLRVAIPYGTINAKQLLKLASIADTYDKGYAHFTTRQNIQFNWIELSQMTDILSELSSVGLHAVQTSGKVVRNITADPLSGIREDEVIDARPYCELIRQWFSLHPEFSWLPGKFKIAINGAQSDDIGLAFHDLGLQAVRNHKQQLGFSVYVGGGLGAAPMIGEKIREFVLADDILSYLESVLRIYNLKGGRGDSKKIRLKFLVKALGAKVFKDLVEQDWKVFKDNWSIKVNRKLLQRLQRDFALPIEPISKQSVSTHPVSFEFATWKHSNVTKHKVPGYVIVNVSLTSLGSTPGNVNTNQLKQLAWLAGQYSQGELRTTKKQDLILPFVKHSDLFRLWQALAMHDLGSPHRNTFAHIVACPGADYCSLAKASSIGLAQLIQHRFYDRGVLSVIGDLTLHISGCENSCAHHHVADIGLLGLKKHDQDFYQITLGGKANHGIAIGQKLGRAIAATQVVEAIERIVAVYLGNRIQDESFYQLLQRIGIQPFKERIYG